MIFKELVLDEILQTAELYYVFNDQNVVVLINAAYTDSSWGVDAEDRVLDHFYVENNGVQTEIKEYEVDNSREKLYSAKFSYKNFEYFLIGTMKKSEFEKILNFLLFF